MVINKSSIIKTPLTSPPIGVKTCLFPHKCALLKISRAIERMKIVVSPFRILERTPQEALKHYLRRHQLRLPDGYFEQAMQLIVQSIMEIEVSQMIEASRYERNGTRRAYRNGYRESNWQNISIRIPKLRSGTYYPVFLEHSDIQNRLTNLIYQTYLVRSRFDDIAKFLEALDIEAHPSQIAELEESLYDLNEIYQERLIRAQHIKLDIVPVDDEGRKRYLALAFGDDELFDYEITSNDDDLFWQDFIRRIDGRSVYGVEYVAVSHIHHIVRLTKNVSPNMTLIAA